MEQNESGIAWQVRSPTSAVTTGEDEEDPNDRLSQLDDDAELEVPILANDTMPAAATAFDGSAVFITAGETSDNKPNDTTLTSPKSLPSLHYTMHEYHPLSEGAGICQRFCYAFMCPPHGRLADLLTWTIGCVLIWATTWSIVGDEALPGGNFFSLIVLVVCAIIGGRIVEAMHLPPLLGMLLAGFILRNVPYIDVGKYKSQEWSSALRMTALTVILTRAGLGLDPKALLRLKRFVVTLAFTPVIVETCVYAVLSHFMLDFPWEWGFLLGFVLAAVSPAVVVPSMIWLQEEGLGVDKGIPTLIMAAASFDDVLAIAGFGVFLGIVFSTGDIWLKVAHGPMELLLGIGAGCIVGWLLWFIPQRDHESLSMARFILLFGSGLLSIFGAQLAGFSGAGALACLTMAFVAAHGWRERDDPQRARVPVSQVMGLLWKIFQPILFTLIGAEVSLERVDPGTIWYGLAMLGIALVFRLIASVLAISGSGLTRREKLFVAIAWLPKATVQAAVGPLALDTANQLGFLPDSQEVQLALKVLTIAVLVIIVTAPLGAVGIALSAPRLLQRQGDRSDMNKTSSGRDVTHHHHQGDEDAPADARDEAEEAV